MQKKRLSNILHEFQHHFPFTVFSALIALIALAIYTELIAGQMGGAAAGGIETGGAGGGEGRGMENVFHVLHPVHVFLSAIATSAMFWRYDRRMAMAIATGFFGSLILCGISDVIFPYVGGVFLTSDMDFHLCIVEEPALVLSFSVMGVAMGIYSANMLNTKNVSKTAHALHVLVSTTASMIYLINFGLTDWIPMLGPVFVILVVSVIIPCCASDIVLPLFLVNPAGVHYCLGDCDEDTQAGNSPGT